MTSQPHLLVEENSSIIICTLNRPEKLNALTSETMASFEEALLHFRDTSDLKVMLIRATGRYFCAGADLLEGPEDGATREIPRNGVAIREMHRLHLRGINPRSNLPTHSI